jgi:endonuclease III
MTRLLANTIDYNDLRVSTPTELASIIESDIFNAVEKTGVLIEVLGSIYARENSVALDKSKTRNRKDARAYLEGLSGMTPYVLSGTMLWAFDEHAIPLDEQMLAVLKKEGLVDPDATMAEAQGFLRRHISAGDAKLFTALLKRHTAQKAPKTPVSIGEPKSRKKASHR